MSHAPKLSSKTRKRLVELCRNLCYTQVPNIQHDALTRLESWITQGHAVLEPYEITLAKQICFCIAGLDVESTSALVKEHLTSCPVPTIESLAPLALTLALKLYGPLDSTAPLPTRSFLECLCAIFRRIGEHPEKTLPRSTITWFSEHCVQEAQNDSCFVAFSNDCMQNVCPFSFSDATRALIPNKCFSQPNQDAFVGHCLEFSTIVLRLSCEAKDSTLPVHMLRVMLKHLYFPSNLKDCVSSHDILLVSRVLTGFLTTISKHLLEDADFAGQLLQGVLFRIKDLALLHTHPPQCFSHGLPLSFSCLTCDSISSVIAQVVSFLMVHLHASDPVTLPLLKQSCYPLFDGLVQFLENTIDYGDFHSAEHYVKWINDMLLGLDYEPYTHPISYPFLASLFDSAYLICFLLWNTQHLKLTCIIECLKFMEALLKMLCDLAMDQSFMCGFPTPHLELMALVSVIAFTLLHIYYHLQGMKSYVDLQGRVLKINLKCEEFLFRWFTTGQAASSLERPSTFIATNTGSVLRYSCVNIVNTFLSAQGHSLQLSNVLNRSIHTLLKKHQLQSVLFIVGSLLHFAVLSHGAVYVPQQLGVIENCKTCQYSCRYCSRHDAILGLLCKLKQHCLIWFLDFFTHYNAPLLSQYLPLILKIATSVTQTTTPRQFSLCPAIRCTAMMVLVTLGQEKLLVPAVYRALSSIYSPSEILSVETKTPSSIVVGISATLDALGELHALGDMPLPKISSLLQYNPDAPLLLKYSRLHVFNLMAEEKPSDAIACLKDIQAGLKDSHPLIQSSALICLGRLCCQDMMDFFKVWSILNGKSYSATILNMNTQTTISLRGLSIFLREYVVRKVVPSLNETIQASSDKAASSKSSSPLPMSLSIALNVMDLLIRMIQTQLDLITPDLTDTQLREAERILAICVETCGRLGELFYLASRVLCNGESWLIISQHAASFFYTLLQSFTEAYSFASASLNHFWKTLLSSNPSVLDFGSASFLTQFLLVIYFRWTILISERPFYLASSLTTLGLTDSLHHGVSRGCFFLLRPFFTQLGRRRTDYDEKPLSFSFLTKAIKPFTQGSRAHTLSRSAHSLLQLSTSCVFSTPYKRQECVSGHMIFSTIKEMIMNLPQLMSSSSIYCTFLPLFWESFLTWLLSHPSLQPVSDDTTCYNTSDDTSQDASVANVLAFSLMNLLHLQASDKQKLIPHGSESLLLYSEDDTNEPFTASGSCEIYLNILYAVSLLSCRTDVSIHFAEFVLDFLSRVFLKSQHSSVVDAKHETPFSDVYELPPQITTTCTFLMIMLYQRRLFSQQFENICLGSLRSILDEDEHLLLDACSKQLGCFPSTFIVPLRTVALMTAALTSLAQHHWVATPQLIRLQVLIFKKLCTLYNEKDSLPQQQDQLKLTDMELVAKGIQQMLEFINHVNATHSNLEVVKEELVTTLYPLFFLFSSSGSFPLDKRSLIIFLPIAQAHKLLTKHQDAGSFSDYLISAVETICQSIESTQVYSFPYITLATCLVLLEDIMMLSKVLPTSIEFIEELQQQLNSLRRLTLLIVSLPQNLPAKETSFYTMFCLEEYWEKRLAILILNGASLSTHHEAYREDRVVDTLKPSFHSKFSSPDELKVLLCALHLSNNNKESWSHEKDLILEKSFQTSNPSFLYQNVLLLGFLLSQLFIPHRNSKICLESLGHNPSPSNNPIALVSHLMMDTSLYVSQNSSTPPLHFNAFVDIMSLLWFTFGLIPDVPDLNTVPCTSLVLQLTTRRIYAEFYSKTPPSLTDLGNLYYIYQLQASLIKACLRLGEHEPKHNIILSHVLSYIFRQLSGLNVECRERILAKNQALRYLVFQLWNALMALFFRLPLTEFKLLFQLGFLGLPRPSYDSILWGFVLQQVVHLCSALYLNFLPSFPASLHTPLIIPTCYSTAILYAANHKIKQRKFKTCNHLGKSLPQLFLTEILEVLLLNVLPGQLFDANSLLQHNSSFPRFHCTLPCHLVASFGELLVAYCQLFLKINAVSSKLLPPFFNQLPIPLLTYAFLIVQDLDIPFILLLDQARNKLLSCKEPEQFNCEDFALCIQYLSFKDQRECLKNLFQCAIMCGPQERCKIKNILVFWIWKMRFPWPLSDTLYTSDIHPKNPWCISSSSPSSYPDWMIDKQSVPVVSSRELFVTEGGIAYLSQLALDSLSQQPIIICSNETFTIPHKAKGEPSRWQWTFPSVVVYPVPACFRPTLQESLDALTLVHQSQPKTLPQNPAETLCFNSIQSYLETWLDFMYFYSRQHPPFIPSYHLDTCLKRRHETFIKRCRYKHYTSNSDQFSQTLPFSRRETIAENKIAINYIRQLGQKVLSALFGSPDHHLPNILLSFSRLLDDGATEFSFLV